MMNTKDYRCKEFEKLAVNSKYNARIKLIKEEGITNWLDITEAELQKIMQILTK